jgi:hypothetical protein
LETLPSAYKEWSQVLIKHKIKFFTAKGGSVLLLGVRGNNQANFTVVNKMVIDKVFIKKGS